MKLAISVAERVFALVKETVEAQNVKLWDVRFVKEGANWYLRVIIDSENGISIDDCTNVHHAIDPVLDESDPIDKSYYLEVCSPGLERELTREEHFALMQGEKVKLKLFYDGYSYTDDVTVIVNGKTYIIQRGVEVEVPRCVKDVLDDAARQERAAQKYIAFMHN